MAVAAVYDRRLDFGQILQRFQPGGLLRKVAGGSLPPGMDSKKHPTPAGVLWTWPGFFAVGFGLS